MRILLIGALMVVSSVVTAAALKYSDSGKVDRAIDAIRIANALAAGDPQGITCEVHLANPPGPVGGRNAPLAIAISLDSGQAYTNLLTAMTNKINADKATAEAYLASVGVTDE